MRCSCLGDTEALVHVTSDMWHPVVQFALKKIQDPEPWAPAYEWRPNIGHWNVIPIQSYERRAYRAGHEDAVIMFFRLADLFEITHRLRLFIRATRDDLKKEEVKEITKLIKVLEVELSRKMPTKVTTSGYTVFIDRGTL